MKKIKQLNTPPPGLEEFLKNHPRERDWDTFRDYPDLYTNRQGQSAYAELREALLNIQHGLCAYCEVDLTEFNNYPPRIDHYCPKSYDPTGRVNWTLKVDNLFAVCQGGTRTNYEVNPPQTPAQSKYYWKSQGNESCDAPKGDKIPDDCHPSQVETEEIIRILKPSQLPAIPSIFKVTTSTATEHAGKISVDRAKCQREGIDVDKAKDTIKELNLNCDRLIDARLAVIEKLKQVSQESLVALGEEATDEQIRASQKRLAQQFLFDQGSKLGDFFTTIRSYFGPVAETILSQPPQEWI